MMKKQHSVPRPTLVAILGFWLLLSPGQGLAQDEAGDGARNKAGADPDFALSRAGDAKNGKLVFGRCRACHGFTSARAKPGPSLENIFGRPAGAEPGYDAYSKALRESGIVWNERTLDEWISNPLDFLPGNKMNVAPIRSAQDRMDLLAYLRQEAGSP
ncbi:MAG: c-type cytochrome [Proteobacteria bacterium]|nr:c-type cytochrome [Pseudomonadota bacterium]